MLRPRPRIRPPRLLDNSRRSLLTLAIETSCDDTAVALLRRDSESNPPAQLLFNARLSSDNRAYGGIHPSVAIRAHHANLAPMVRSALRLLPGRSAPDLVAATRGPGVAANLAVGLEVAKGLALAWGVPLVGVHHMQAHALTPRLVNSLRRKTMRSEESPAFPFLSLLVSGGHTQLVSSSSLTDHRILINTVDIAIGNLLDQAARVILPASVLEGSADVMYGRLLEAFAFPSDSDDVCDQHAAFFRPALSRSEEQITPDTGYDWSISLPFRESRRLDFSFCGIFSQVRAVATARPDMDMDERRHLARHTMRAAFQHLASRLCLVLAAADKDDDRSKRLANLPLVLAGGVSANRFLLHVLRATLSARGFSSVAADMVVAPLDLCTDNAAMVAWAADEMFRAGWETDLSASPVPRWPLDPDVGDGLLGVGGWLRRDKAGKHGDVKKADDGLARVSDQVG
ncbi:hypothetical protein CP533_5705 [Ophiocordyceps camponoti-saundersi (nom. inval.)]|nr:hypothetical protein CP533_5705 [Ophiocordyceps camponoti-saundersi (nom. inval.)]